jgi:hypothetical protein
VLTATSVEAARPVRLNLAEVPHYELPIPPNAIPLKQPYYKSDFYQGDSSYRGTENNPFVAKIIPGERSEEEKAAIQEKAELDGKLTDYTGDLASYTKCLFVATLLLALLTGALARAAYRQIRESRQSIDATVKLADAAAEHAGHAERAIKVTEESAVRQLRAYVFVKEMKYASHFNPVGQYIWWSITPIWENSGATFTRELFININSSLRDDDLPDDFKFPPSEIAYNSPTLIGPRSSIIGAEVHIVGEDLTAVRDGKKHLFVWGWAKYHDVFSGTPERVTKFCHIVLVRGDTTKSISPENVVEFVFRNHRRHNCADEDCDREEPLR